MTKGAATPTFGITAPAFLSTSPLRSVRLLIYQKIYNFIEILDIIPLKFCSFFGDSVCQRARSIVWLINHFFHSRFTCLLFLPSAR